MAGSAAANAQTGTFISNFGQLLSDEFSHLGGSDIDLAQQFTTGSVTHGYEIQSIVLHFRCNETDKLADDCSEGEIGSGTLTVTLRENLSNNRPGSVLHTLTNPATVTNGGETGAENVFTVPEGTILTANTKYHIMLEYSSNTDPPGWSVAHPRKVQGAAAGWGIAGQRQILDGGFWLLYGNPLAIDVRGMENPTPEVSVSDASVAEGDAGENPEMTFTVSLSSDPLAQVTVDWATANGTAVAGTDYTAGSGSLTFSSGETTKTVTVAVTGDDVDEPNETFTVTLSNPSAAAIGDGTGIGTITDDDPPEISVSDASVTEGDDGATATMTFTVSLSSAPSAQVTVDWATSDGTAAAGTDYTAGSGGLIFNSGETTKTVSVTVTGDDVDEPNETFEVRLSNPSGGTIGDGTGIGTITDDDPPALSVSDASVTEGDDGATATMTFTVSLSSDPPAQVTVDWATADGTATAGTDYTAGSGGLIFNSGETTKTVTVAVTGDDVDEPNETFEVRLSNPSGGTIGDGTGIGTITDDDPPETSVSDASVAEGGDGATATMTFTVSLTSAPAAQARVDWATAGGTAVAGTDYTAGSGRLTFSSGETTKTFTVTVTGDDVDEPDETFTVTLSNPSGATIGDGAGTGTITNDDDDPTVTLVLAPDSIGENGGVSAVTATLNHPSSAATTVTVSAAPVGPAVAGDYALSTNRTLTIAPGETASTGAVTVAAQDNDADAPDKEVTVSATAVNGQGITAPQDATLTITDDEGPPAVTLVLTPPAVGENGGVSTVTAVLGRPSSADTAVTVSAAPVSPAVAGDYALSTNRTLTIAAGETASTGVVKITAQDNDVHAANKEVAVSGTAVNGQGITAPQDVTLTITDDEAPPTVTLVLAPPSIGEDGGVSTVTAALNRASGADTAVTVSAAPVSPAVAGDYALSTNRTLTIAAGNTTSTGVVTVTAQDNAVDALDKEVTVSGTAANGQGITGPQDVTLTITDDDMPELSIANASIAEGGNGATATLTFTVTLTPAATLPVTVDWDTADGTAAAGTDYTAANGSLAFSNGDGTKTITVAVTGDDVDEPDETFTVTLSSPLGATIGDGAGTGTITNDDGDPAVTLILTPPSVGEDGGVSTVTARLSHRSSADTAVTVSAAPVSPAVAGDYTVSTNRELTIAAGAVESTGVVTITAVDNAVDTADKEVTVSGTAMNGQGITAPQDVTLTITDDDTPRLSVADAGVTEGGAGTSAALTFTVTLDPPATQPAAVDWATSDGTATAGSDYQSGRGTLSFAVGDATKTVTVTVTGDNVDEPNETVTVELSNASGANIGAATGTGTITDDDGPPVVTLILTPSSVGEDGGVSTVTAAQNGLSSEDTAVTISAAPVGMAVASDYTLSGNAVLTIAAGETASTGAVTITARDNAVDALDKQVTVSGAAENLQGVTGPQDVTLAITDDDEPALSIGDASVAEGADGATATLTFTVRLTPAATLPVTVDWATSDGTASAGADYTAGNGSLTFASGEDTKTIAVTVLGDNLDEPDETLTVTLSNAPGASIGGAMGTGTITDDDLPAVTVSALTETVREGRNAVFIVTRASADIAAPLPVAFSLTDPGAVLAPNPPATATIPPRAATVRVTLATVRDNIEEPDTAVTLTLASSADYVVGQPDAATITISDAGVLSALAEGRRAGAGSLLRRHSERFAHLTTDLALRRLAGERRESEGRFSLGSEGVSAEGGLAADLSSGWDGWASIRYSDLDGSAEGAVWEVYAGADTRSADGRTAYGLLAGYEPGRVTAEDVRLEAHHLHLGLYGSHRLSGTLTMDGALGWGRGSIDLSLADGVPPVTASHSSRRIMGRAGLTGDFGWGGGGLRVEPQIGLLYAQEELEGFTDSIGHDAPSERLWRARLGLGPKVTWELDESTTHGMLRVNLDSHNLESAEDRTTEISVSLDFVHRWETGKSGALDLSASFDGLWTGWFTSIALGLKYELKF